MAYLLSLTPFMPNVFKYTPIDTALIPHICVLVTKLAVLVSTNTFIKSVSALINTAYQNEYDNMRGTFGSSMLNSTPKPSLLEFY